MENRLLSHMLGGVIRDYGQPVMLWQAGVLIGALALAWLLARLLRHALETRHKDRYEGLRFGAESLTRALFPLIGAGCVWVARAIASNFIHTSLLNLALVPLFGIGLIYVAFFFARRVFGRDGHTHAWLSIVEKVVSLIVWLAMLFTVLGIQDDVLAWMESVRFRIGTAHVSLLSLSNGVLWVCVTMVVAVWAGAALEERLMRATTIDANLRVVLARVGRAALVFAAVLLSLSIVGIDITVLGVFGGALGVGLGFGLQKIASNYVSGFIILIDRSLRLGDTINVAGLAGKVTQIRTRYTVVRGLDGVETLIPNEKLITDVVQNQSSYLTRGYAKAAVQVAYDTNLEEAMTLLKRAAEGVERVLADPAPTPYLVGFGADGINLELGFWIADAASGTSGVRSAVNLNIWRLYNEHGISIPFAQREVRIIGQPMPVTQA
jgi:small-conductance mechanosensitive channel